MPGEADRFKGFGNLPLYLGGGELFHLQAEGDVVEDVHVGEKGIALENGVGPALVRRQGGDVVSVQQNGPVVGSFEAADQPQYGRLSTA